MNTMKALKEQAEAAIFHDKRCTNYGDAAKVKAMFDARHDFEALATPLRISSLLAEVDQLLNESLEMILLQHNAMRAPEEDTKKYEPPIVARLQEFLK